MLKDEILNLCIFHSMMIVYRREFDETGDCTAIWEGGQIVGKRNVLRRSIKQNWCLNQVLH